MHARNSLLILLSIVLIQTQWTSSASSQEKTTTLGREIASRSCTTNQSDRWICAGDPAWSTGYLVEPGVMGRIVAMRSEHGELRLLVDRLVLERDTAIEQRDAALEAVDARDVKLYEWESRERDVRLWANAQKPAPDWAGRVLFGVVGAGVGVLVGVMALR